MRTSWKLPCLSLMILAIALAGGVPASAQDAEETVAPEAAALSGHTYREIGPANMGGRVSDIIGVPGDPKTFWVGGADGGLWKTTNGGTTFTGQWQDEEAYSVGSIALAPSDHNVLYLGSGEGDPRNSVSYGLGVWRSTDGGDTWKHLGLRDTERIHRLRVHPTDPDTVWVCAMGHEWGANADRGVFRTTDGGMNWEKVLYIDEDTGCSDLDVDLSNPRNIYAGMWTHRRKPWRFDGGSGETAVYKSTDGGSTWKKLDVVDEPMARIGISVAQSQPGTVYVITETPTKGSLFRTDDGGASWRMVSADRNINFRPFYYSTVRVDPNNPEAVWALSGRLSKSTDGGRTFEQIAQGVHGDHQSLWIDPGDSDHVLSGSDGGYQVSFDNGVTWDIINNVALSQYYQIFVDDRDPYFVCGGLQDNGNWCGPSRMLNSGGWSSGGIRKDEWYEVSGGDGFYAVPVPGKPWLIYSTSQGGYLRVSDIRTGITQSIEPYPRMIGSSGQGMFRARYRFNWDAPLHVSPHDPGIVYWGGNVLFKSTDYGHSWEVISPDLTTNDPEKLRDSGGEIYNDNTAAEFHCTILSLEESPLEAGVIFAGTDDGNVQVTQDGGTNWTLVNGTIPGLPAEAWVSKIDASNHVAGRFYVNVDQHRLDDFTPHVWRCDDYGATCTDLSAGLPQDDYTKVIREDPTNPDLLYVGMDRGLYISWDGGETWVDMRLNLPRVSVRDIKVQRDYNDLVVGTHGRGAFIFDSISPLQELQTAMAEDAYLFTVGRATHWVSWSYYADGGQRTYAGENPPNGAIIDFWLAEKPEGAVKIRIADADGTAVQNVDVAEPKKGVNRATWNLRHEGPRPARSRQVGGFFSRFARGFGAPALPGDYTATLVVADGEGNETETEARSFTLRGDPRMEMSAEHYQEWHDGAARLVELASQANELVDDVAGLNDQVEGLGEAAGHPSVADAEQVREQIGTALDQLAQLNDKLQRPPEGMGYRDYPRLQEETMSLMFGVMGTQARPTEGQLEVLTELEGDVKARRDELQAIIDGSIRALNEMLGDLPAIRVDQPSSEEGGASQ